uniref:Uncharacterized protein n=1 Tax=Heterorhabditis bacteriophora TaxID=37862 RepID=A0A1I7X0B1_HETBA
MEKENKNEESGEAASNERGSNDNALIRGLTTTFMRNSRLPTW